MAKRTLRPRSESRQGDYPNLESAPTTGCTDLGRRRFLKQLGAAGGGLTAATGLATQAIADDTDVEFRLGVLAQHPTLGQLGAEKHGHTKIGPIAPSDTSRTDDRLAVNPDWITEDRALWIEPGYMVLVRLSRPPSDLSVLERFESSASLVETYLNSNVVEVSHLHDITLVHAHEVALAELIATTIAPGLVEVVHLDHNCQTVCSGLSTGGYWGHPDVQVDGGIGSPEW